MLVITGDDRPGAFISALQSLDEYFIEAAWLRSVGKDAGCILLMISSPKIIDNTQLMGLETRVKKFVNGMTHANEDNRVPMEPVVLEVPSEYKPVWDERDNPQIVFNIYGNINEIGPDKLVPYNSILGDLIPEAAATAALGPHDYKWDCDITQHDSGFSKNTPWNTFRVTWTNSPKTNELTQNRYLLQRVLQSRFNLLSSSKLRVDFGTPSSRLLTPGSLGAPDHDKWYTIQFVMSDKQNLLDTLYPVVSDAGLVIKRTCCRGIGGIGVLIYSGLLRDGIFLDSLQDTLDKSISRINGERNISDKIVSPKAFKGGHPFDLYQGSQFKAVNVFSTSFSEDKHGTLLAACELLMSRDATTESVYFLDAIPSLEHKNRFTIRMGVLYPDVNTARLRAVTATAALLGRSTPFEKCDRVSCDTFELIDNVLSPI